MFTGIVECTARLASMDIEGTNRIFWFESPISNQLKIDQSVSHSGVCLTVDALEEGRHRATAIAETLKVTALGFKNVGDLLNLERGMKPVDRFDGHWVQGHVDCTAQCTDRASRNGSWDFRFSHGVSDEWITVPKGSICVDGVSLTVVESEPSGFSVSIIPYTYEHTGFSQIKTGDVVNLEFDILGKYIARLLAQRGIR